MMLNSKYYFDNCFWFSFNMNKNISVGRVIYIAFSQICRSARLLLLFPPPHPTSPSLTHLSDLRTI